MVLPTRADERKDEQPDAEADDEQQGRACRPRNARGGDHVEDQQKHGHDVENAVCENRPDERRPRPFATRHLPSQHGNPRQLADPTRQQRIREQADREGREDERHARPRRLHRRVDHERPGEGAGDHRQQVQQNRDDDPVPLHRAECAAERREAVAPPPEQTDERRHDDEPQEHPHNAALGQAEEIAAAEIHPAIIVGRPVRLRSPHDREIVRLALPALGALAAEPLYVLADTAIVGHLGRPQIAALGLAGTVLAGAFTIFNFLTYGTTAVVARASGAGREDEAARIAAQALWASVGIGAALLVVCEVVAEPLLAGLGGHGHSGELALLYFRIAAFGLPAALIALAGQGYLRGVSNLRRPLEIVVVANLANLVLEVLFVYVFHWGIAGSAAGTAIAQAGMAAAFVVELLRPPAPSRRPSRQAMKPLFRIGRQIFVRTVALYASFLFAASVLARMGDAQIGAHQIGYQLFVFIALVLDAVAIAGQVIVGRMLGAGAAPGAFDAARRMCWWSLLFGIGFGLVLLASSEVIPRAFTTDDAVVER